jgi:perosamine synthetase
MSFDARATEAFESDVARLFGVRHALACNNGTAAAFSAFKALGIGPGDTIIGPAITHWASVLPAAQCGAQLALADVLPGTCHIDPASVLRLIDRHTRAVVVTHMFGQARELAELRRLCDIHHVALVEDVSHAHGATFDGKPVGSFGDVSFCSFQAAKLVSAGEGGALLTNRDDIWTAALELGHPRRLHQARATSRPLVGVGRGFKFQPSAILVALAHGSLRDLHAQNQVRRNACGLLRAFLAESGLFTDLEPAPTGRVYFRCELHLSDDGALAGCRDDVVRRLRAAGVRADHVFGYLPGHPALLDSMRPGAWPQALSVMRNVFCLEPFTVFSPAAVRRHAARILDAVRASVDARGKR